MKHLADMSDAEILCFFHDVVSELDTGLRYELPDQKYGECLRYYTESVFYGWLQYRDKWQKELWQNSLIEIYNYIIQNND